MDPYRIETLKALKINGISNPGSTVGGFQTTDLIVLPNGAFITCGVDKSISLWEEKRGNESCAACCSIF